MKKAVFSPLVAFILAAFLSVTSGAETGGPGQGGSKDNSGGQTTTSGGAQGGPGYERLRPFLGKVVKNPKGEVLGRVRDFIFVGGRARYVIFSPAGAGGQLAKMIPVPWSVADLRFENGQAVADLSPERLLNAPAFNELTWPNFSQNSYQQKIGSYYEQK